MCFVGDDIKSLGDDERHLDKLGISEVPLVRSWLNRMGQMMDLIQGATQVAYLAGGTSDKCLVAEETASVLPCGMKANLGLASSATRYAPATTAEVEPSSRAAKFFNSSPVMWDVSLNTETISMRRLFSWVAVVGFGM